MVLDHNIEELPPSSKRGTNGKAIPIEASDTQRSVCQYHRSLENKVDAVRRTQRRHTFGMWAVGTLVTLVGVAIPSCTSMQIAKLGTSRGVEQKLDELLRLERERKP